MDVDTFRKKVSYIIFIVSFIYCSGPGLMCPRKSHFPVPYAYILPTSPPVQTDGQIQTLEQNVSLAFTIRVSNLHHP